MQRKLVSCHANRNHWLRRCSRENGSWGSQTRSQGLGTWSRGAPNLFESSLLCYQTLGFASLAQARTADTWSQHCRSQYAAKFSVSFYKAMTRTCVSSSREAKKLSAAVAQLILSLSRNLIVQDWQMKKIWDLIKITEHHGATIQTTFWDNNRTKNFNN